MGALSYTVESKNNGKPSVTMMVTQTAGSNATEIATNIKKLLKEQEAAMPPGIHFDIMQDVTEFLFASIEDLIKTLCEAFILVFIVVYIFLQDTRSTLIPLIAVPVSLIGTFFFLYAFGFSLNLLTLAALVLAIAIVVDDAIVVVEAVHAKLDLGYKSAKLASIDAMNEISGAIISITLVMASVFIPVSFMGGTSGAFYREFGITMAISIIISALNALTFRQPLCYLAEAEGRGRQGAQDVDGRPLPRIVQRRLRQGAGEVHQGCAPPRRASVHRYRHSSSGNRCNGCAHGYDKDRSCA